MEMKTFGIGFATAIVSTLALSAVVDCNVFGIRGAAGPVQTCDAGHCYTAGNNGNCTANGPANFFDCPGQQSTNSTQAASGACGSGYTVQGDMPAPDDVLNVKVGKQATLVGYSCMTWSYGGCVWTSTPNKDQNGNPNGTYTLSCGRDANNSQTGQNGSRNKGSGDSCS